MTRIKTKIGRRSFLRTSAAAGGGLMVSFSWLAACQPIGKEAALTMPKEWFDFNAFIKIGENGAVTIKCPNPEFGQGVKTSMPMIFAYELDVYWKQVMVDMAPFNTDLYPSQLSGGSQSIRQGWKTLRMAGATARHVLKKAAADVWQVPMEEITTDACLLFHKNS